MDKIDAYFTRTIVGKSTRVSLGAPAALDEDPGFMGEGFDPALDLDPVDLEQAPVLALSDLPEVAGRSDQPQPPAAGPASGEAAKSANRLSLLLLLGPGGFVAAVGAILIAWLIGGSVFLHRGYEAPGKASAVQTPAPPSASSTTASDAENSGLPIRPATDAASAPRTGEALPSQTSSIAVSAAEFGSEAPPAGPVVLKPVAQAPIASLPAKTAPKVPAVQPARQKQEEKQSSLVVDSTPSKAPAAAAASPVQAAPAPAAPGGTKAPAGAVKLVSPTVEIPAKAAKAEGPRVTVVDIDKAGAFVLITNPQTRLPQKVELGKAIFTGETIQKIEPSSGRIHLDSGRVVTMQ